MVVPGLACGETRWGKNGKRRRKKKVWKRVCRDRGWAPFCGATWGLVPRSSKGEQVDVCEESVLSSIKCYKEKHLTIKKAYMREHSVRPVGRPRIFCPKSPKLPGGEKRGRRRKRKRMRRRKGMMRRRGSRNRRLRRSSLRTRPPLFFSFFFFWTFKIF